MYVEAVPTGVLAAAYLGMVDILEYGNLREFFPPFAELMLMSVGGESTVIIDRQIRERN